VPRGTGSVGGTTGRASVGAGTGSVGAARVGGRASVGRPGVEDAYGVNAAPGYGSRPVARAAVRPVSPAVGGAGGPDDPPGTGPGRRGSASKILTKAAKKRRRANILTAAAAVLIILVGASVVGGTYFFDNVEFNEPAAESQTTQIMASDKKTVLASLGKFNRSVVPYQSINPIIGEAVMAAEDKNFQSHHGIDAKGIMRAAWNNFTGGETQGASTITQQYARHAADLKGISYNRKLREAVIARKMEDKYGKDEILGRYLNSVYFGRGAYGIEAAVKAYFGPSRSALTQPGQKGAITAGEAAIIASVIKQPEPVKGGHQGFDPARNPTAALERWNYTLNNMVEKKWLPAAQRPTKYPAFKPLSDACSTSCGNDKPVGKIVKYVQQELRAMGINDDQWKQGGLQIQTTINPEVQAAAEQAANGANKKSPLHDLKDSKTYHSALVAIDPTRGRVLAYYGGPKGDGVGWDYAGPNYGDDGTLLGGGRPPGSTFKIYTLLAALKAGYGFDTTWDSTLKKVNGGGPINNSGREGSGLQCDPVRCPLSKATEQSYNFAFYWLADKLGPAKVIEAAHAAGIRWLGDPETAKRQDLDKLSEKQIEALGYGREVGFGQYAITALDHANGMATIAANGTYNKAHFVREVDIRDKETGKFVPFKGKSEKLDPQPAFSKDVAAALQNVLEKIPAINHKTLDDGRDAIGKTGTWEFTGKGGKSGENGDAWMVGATPQLAASVWIGREKEDPKTHQMVPLPIKKPGGGNMNGGSVPGDTWKMFLDAAMKAMNAPEEKFLPDTTSFVDPSKKGNGKPAPVVVTPPEQECALGFVCPPNNGNGGNGNGDNGGNGNGDNGGNGNGDNGGNGGNGGNNPGNIPATLLPTAPPTRNGGGGGGQNQGPG
jgi:membrane peptidoglycan carboxypeptidase